jgi:hypothetical protein
MTPMFLRRSVRSYSRKSYRPTDTPFGGIVQAGQQFYQSGFAGAVLDHQRQLFTRLST